MGCCGGGMSGLFGRREDHRESHEAQANVAGQGGQNDPEATVGVWQEASTWIHREANAMPDAKPTIGAAGRQLNRMEKRQRK